MAAAEEKEKRRRGWRGLTGVLIVILSLISVYLWSQVWAFLHEDWDGTLPGRTAENEVLSVTYPDFDISQDTRDALRAKAKKDKSYKPLSKHPEYYPEDLLRQALRNKEVLDFALGYPKNVEKDWDPDDITLDESDGIPHYLQWDTRWGYGAYGSSVVGVSGCGPTCLSMAVVGLTGDTDANPLAVADYCAGQGWYVPGAGTDWELMRSGAEHYGLHWQELSPEEETLRRVLDAGGCVIASVLPGDFTGSGHFIVISGFDAKGFRVLDPNSEKLSHSWDFDQLKPQIAALWGYTA